jgi:quinol monooxygenase YgiN
MNATIAITDKVTTLINVLTVHPDNHAQLIALLRDNTENVITGLDGWISTSFVASKDRRKVVIYSQLRDAASVDAMRTNPGMVAYFPKIAAIAALDSLAGDVVYSHHA